jgi:hypothetical protein
VVESSRPAFKSAGTPAHVNPATSYTQVSQMARLTALLGSQAQAERFLTSSSFMARGHMAPDGDGIFKSWQFTTYFYTNVVPQWQVRLKFLFAFKKIKNFFCTGDQRW